MEHAHHTVLRDGVKRLPHTTGRNMTREDSDVYLGEIHAPVGASDEAVAGKYHPAEEGLKAGV